MEFLFFIWILVNGADIITTEGAIRSGMAREANPFLTNTKVRIPLKVGITVGGVVAIKKWHKKHPRLVKSYAIAASVLYGSVAIHNYRVWKRRGG